MTRAIYLVTRSINNGNFSSAVPGPWRRSSRCYGWNQDFHGPARFTYGSAWCWRSTLSSTPPWSTWPSPWSMPPHLPPSPSSRVSAARLFTRRPENSQPATIPRASRLRNRSLTFLRTWPPFTRCQRDNSAPCNPTVSSRGYFASTLIFVGLKKKQKENQGRFLMREAPREKLFNWHFNVPCTRSVLNKYFISRAEGGRLWQMKRG